MPRYNVNDVPISSKDEDAFSVYGYAEAVAAFIEHSQMPTTIAIQGEWGSGKTSFMKLLECRLTDPKLPEDRRYDSLWLNTWQLFSQNEKTQVVMKLYADLIAQLTEKLSSDTESTQVESTKKTMLKTFRNVSNVMLNLVNVETESLDRMWEDVNNLQAKQLIDPKQQLEALVMQQIRKSGNGVTDKGFLVFIDDLDRLEPIMAVTLLEALKNLLDIQGCVFVLALDYDVIKAGVEKKYGFGHVNGRDVSRDFFDKIVQLPFTVPMTQYDVMPMVMERLNEMHFFDSVYNYAAYRSKIASIVVLATNNNPRTLKTILNLLQIVLTISRFGEACPSYRLLMLLLVSLQKSFPEVYIRLASDIDPARSNQFASDANNDGQNPVNNTDADDAWQKRFLEAIPEMDPHGRRFHSACHLLSIYALLRDECEQLEVPLDGLFNSVSMLNGFDNRVAEVRYQGEAYDRSSQTQHQQGRQLLDRIDCQLHQDVLDVGCGNGKTTLELWDQNKRMNITAVDISETQISKAVDHYQHYMNDLQNLGQIASYHGDITFEVLDAKDMRFHDQFDLVFSNSALHWIPKPKLVYSKLYRALKPRGNLAVHQGGYGTYRGLHDNARKAISNLGLADRYRGWKFPAFYPEPYKIANMLRSIGFEDVSVDSVVTDGSESNHLVENFAVASLVYYQKADITEPEYQSLFKEFMRICREEGVDLYTHRLFITARKPG